MAASVSVASYPPAERGHATSTKTTYRYAKMYFDIFGLTQGFDSLDEMLAADRVGIMCDVAMWREFATWLHTYGRQISNQDKHIEVGAALNYLSSLTQLCSRKWPTHHTWSKNSFDTWYLEIRTDVQNVIGRREIQDGDDDGEELQDIDRHLLMLLNEMWNKNGSSDAILKASAESMTFFCLGRAGEFAYVSHTDSLTHFCSVNLLIS